MTVPDTNTSLTLLNTILLLVAGVLSRSERRRRKKTSESVENIVAAVNGDRERMIAELAALRKDVAARGETESLDNATFQRQLQSLQHENKDLKASAENLKAAAIVDDARRKKLARDAAKLNELMQQANTLTA